MGTGLGITISSSTGSVVVQEGGTITLVATVANDVNSAGVTWSLSGLGALSDATTGQVTYSAPPIGTVTGTSTPIVTATSVADTTKTSTVSLVVSGAPVIDPITLFPANANTPWGVNILVIGGEGPYAWALDSGTLPPGITLSSSTTATVTLSGTPTSTGSYSFRIKVTDNQSRTATVDLALVVNAQAACLLNGRYAMLYTGYAKQRPQTRAASIAVAGDGTVSGLMDSSSGTGSVASEAVTGTCTTRTANNGMLTLQGGSSGQLVLDYSMRTTLDRGRVQLTSPSGDTSGTGLIAVQDASAFTLAQLPVTAAFGLVGFDANDNSMGLAGRLDRDAAGNVTGRADSNGTPTLDAAALSGQMGAPDPTTGRGALTLSIGGSSYPFVYYVVDASHLLLVNMDTTAATPQRLAGFLTPRAAAFDATALAAPAILSLWGHKGTVAPVAVNALGRLSNGNASAGTLNLYLDTAAQALAVVDVNVTGVPYAVDSDGRATLGFTSSGTAHSLVMYLDGVANGYVVDKTSDTGGSGLLEAQAAGPFDSTLPGWFVLGTQFAQSLGPMTQAPRITFSGGVLSGSYTSGYYSLDSATGRGIGTWSISGIGSGSMVMYVVRPDRVVLLQFGSINRDAALDWIEK